MAQCSYCNNKGFFLTVSNDGLCKICAPSVSMVVNQLVRIIKESNDLVESTKNFKTKIGRLDIIETHLQTLDKDYYSKGIKVLSTPPQEILHEVRAKRVEAIEEEALLQTQKSMDKAHLAKTATTKINNANKALLTLKQFQDEYEYTSKELSVSIIKYIHQTEYEDLLIKAEKEEFKGNKKKAIDRYQDVLFFLMKDDIDDDIQAVEIMALENKIEELSKE
ncbi:hypothetical protein [Sporosarcina sp. G11-34]|uniref:hypothetical protein n=1 Tax=Sporosarcina sp. G11-34 TaxID=2849605 RepID=UPI0022A97BF0|nr:hypothetical protein [Sporosarcina sp. G11-34]MCZ2260629.1 hypothetical protein [Sporosarcina sp. G11-34]